MKLFVEIKQKQKGHSYGVMTITKQPSTNRVFLRYAL